MVLFTVKRYGVGLLVSVGAVALMRDLRTELWGGEWRVGMMEMCGEACIRGRGGGIAYDDLGVPGADGVVLILGHILQGTIASLVSKVVRNGYSW
jgi:hypothetical protein